MHESDPTITNSSYSSSKTRINKKPFIIGAIILLLAGIILFVIFGLPALRKQPEPEGSDGDTVVELTVDNNAPSSYVQIDDFIAELEQNVASQKATGAAASDVLVAQLDLVSYLVAVERYERAEAIMSEISTDGFNTGDFYRYYNVYSRVYENRDQAKYDQYRVLTVDYLNKLQDETLNPETSAN